MKSSEIRQKFFQFFVARGHTQVPSSSLIPADDPTLLFANAGMNQFKDIFLGKEKRSYTRAVTIQKCIRAGGKHNDLDNVGRTARHHTFFEMLGNFSFGDYFKREAIRFAWDFLTTEIKLDPERLYASVYQDDDEAYEIWHKEIGLPKERIVKLGRADNFWQMGDTGPCGPCSEIYYDRGARTKAEETCKPGDDCERFLEIWNLVFMQFERQADGRELPLTSKGIDTGMGLERLCSVVQDTPTNYETDLFAGLIAALEKFSGKSYQNADVETKTAFRVLIDHIRSSCLAIADGGMPANEGRGYVLRKIIRRAALFAQELGDTMFFAQLAPVFINEMGSIYPELIKNKGLIVSVITSELEKFAHNLTQGKIILAKYLEENRSTKRLSGEQVFKLYDTYGFPFELTSIVAHEKGYTIDVEGFDKAMAQQREQSGKKQEAQEELTIETKLATTFMGYEKLSLSTPITGLFVDNKEVNAVPAGTSCWIITAETPLYVECGGQTSDAGFITIDGKQTPIKAVQKIEKAVVCNITAPAPLAIGTQVTVSVDEQVRASTARNHTATHLLQAALVQILGPQVKQAGSLVCADYLRFDFTHHEPLPAEQITKIEKIVNAIILENRNVSTNQTTYQEAVRAGATAFFGEKYNPESVRVVTVSGFSSELCGGTHVAETGTIGCFKITSSSALATGVRRLTAVTGFGALNLFQGMFQTVQELATHFKVQTAEVRSAVAKQEELLKKQEHETRALKQQLVQLQIPSWLANTANVHGIPFGFIHADAQPKELKEIATTLNNQKPGFYFIYATSATGFTFYCVAAPAFGTRINMQKLSQALKDRSIKGGLAGNALQGGSATMPSDLQDLLTNAVSAS